MHQHASYHSDAIRSHDPQTADCLGGDGFPCGSCEFQQTNVGHWPASPRHLSVFEEEEYHKIANPNGLDIPPYLSDAYLDGRRVGRARNQQRLRSLFPFPLMAQRLMRELFSVKRARPSPEGGAHASHMAGASLPATPLSQPAVAAGSTAGTVGDDCQLCVADGCPSSSADGQLDEASPRRSPLASSAAGSSAGSVEQKQTLTKDMTAENIKIELMKIHDALALIVGPLPSLQRETKISMLATLVALIAAANQTNSYSSVGYTRIVSQWPGGGGEPDFQAMRRDPQLLSKLAHCLRSGKSFNVKANYITELLEKEPSADELDAFVATASKHVYRGLT